MVEKIATKLATMVQEAQEIVNHHYNPAGDIARGCPEICEGCQRTIADRFIMRVLDSSWHEECLVCCVCRVQLSNSCFARDNKLYCKLDYDRLFSVKCAGCGDRLLPHELVMRAQQLVFHLHCFACVVCCQVLQKGDQYVLRGHQLFCRADYEKELFLLQQQAPQSEWLCPLGDDFIVEEGSRPRDGRRGPKRPRTILTSAQRKQFMNSFNISPKPCRKVREQLGKETGLSVRVVQVWFQNQRAKMKKLQRRAKHNNENNNNNNDDKDDKDDKSDVTKKEVPDGSFGGLTPLDSVDSPYATTPKSASGGAVAPYSPEAESYPAHSGDSFCGSDLSLDDSRMDGFEDDRDTSSTSHSVVQQQQQQSISSLSSSLSGPHTTDVGNSGGLVGVSASLYPQINPIDKLYLMHNSYFEH